MADENGRTFLGSLAAEIPMIQSNTWCNLVKNFMVCIMMLANSFYCELLGCYDGLYEPLYLHPIYWTLILEGVN